MQQLTRSLRLWLAVTARAARQVSREAPAVDAVDAYGWSDIHQARRDFGVVVFGLLAVAALVASVPYTFIKVMRLHEMTEIGIAQSIGSLIVFEAGAFLAKVATLFIPAWRGRLSLTQAGLLLIVAVANYQVAHETTPSAAWVELAIFVALMPFLQWLFLGLSVARAEALHQLRLAARREPTPAEQAQASLEAMRDRVWSAFVERSLALMDEQTRALGSFPAPQHSAQHAREGVLTPSWTCHTCGAEASQQKRAAYRSARVKTSTWRCEACEALNERPVG